MLSIRFTLLLICIVSMFVDFAKADVNIVAKAQWSGDEAKTELTKLMLPVARVIITHTAGLDCNNDETCAQQVRNIQNYQMKQLNFDDIAYNFLVGNNGNVYEGRGWEQQGAFAKGYNAGSLGITFIGNYEKSVPSEKALEAAKSLLEMGVQTGKITDDYKLFGHRQLTATDSPGAALYAIIKQWPHWSRKA